MQFGYNRPDIKIHAIKIDLLLEKEYNFQTYISMMKEQLKKKLSDIT